MTPHARQAMLCGGCEREGCRLCFLYRTRDDYRAHWDGVKLDISCLHRGEELRREECKKCGKKGMVVKIRVYSCDIYKECQMGKDIPELKSCKGCASRIPATNLVV